jgi:hypothetical protein
MADEPQDPPAVPVPVVLGDAPSATSLPPSHEPTETPTLHPTIRPFNSLAGGKHPDAPAAAKPEKPKLDPKEQIRRMSLQERREFIYNARLQGWTWHKLAAHFDMAVSTMQKAYEARRRQVADNESDQVRHLSYVRLETVIQGCLPKATAGDAKAADAVIKAIESQRRMYGIDAPLKVASTTPDGTKWAPLAVDVLVKSLSLDELKTLEKAARLKLLPSAPIDVDAVRK